jgi:uncharacterized protein YecA (UPF0149 family)
MRLDTGEIITEDQARRLNATHPGIAVPLNNPLSPKQARLKKVGRNELCPCRSGHKFKKCCMLKPKVAVR